MQRKERDRELTEEKLVNAVGELIAEDGFENLGINKVAERAGVSKNLIYRYFDSLDGLISAYMKKHDFWINTSMEIPDVSNLRGYLKGFMRQLIRQFREDIALKRLRRWELSSGNETIREVQAQREKMGSNFIEIISRFSDLGADDVKAISALINAGINYLVMFEENCHVYNGIQIDSDEGWEQVAKGIDILIDLIINEKYG